MATEEDKSISVLKSILYTTGHIMRGAFRLTGNVTEELQRLKAVRRASSDESSDAKDDDLLVLTNILTEVHLNLLQFSEGLDRAENIVKRLDQNSTLEEFINTKLSDAARIAIENSDGPLKPEDLKNFLKEVAFGEPKPEILPIIRRNTQHVEVFINQLNIVKEGINQAHVRYREEQEKLDNDLNKRIDTLVAKIWTELVEEACGN